jgi:hypothetical protein
MSSNDLGSQILTRALSAKLENYKDCGYDGASCQHHGVSDIDSDGLGLPNTIVKVDASALLKDRIQDIPEGKEENCQKEEIVLQNTLRTWVKWIFQGQIKVDENY